MKIVGDTPKIVSANLARVHLIHHLSNLRSFQNTKHVIRFLPPRGLQVLSDIRKKKKDSPILFIYSINFNGAAGDT